jgi:curved DNA-binding protein
MNYYEKLGVSENATHDEIKKAYRRLSKKYHPDANDGNDARFKEISQAYDVIGDKKKRADYDNQRVQEDFFSRFNQQDRYNMSDMFDQVFGNAFNSQQRRQKGRDIKAQVHVSFDEAFHGTTRDLDVNGERIKMKFKAGLKTGQRFKVEGKGHPHQLNTSLPNGDLVVEISVIHDPVYILQGNNIWVEKSLPWYDLMLGYKLMIDSPDGPVNLKIPEGTTPEKVLRVRGRGYPIYGTDKCGDLLVKIHATYQKLNEKQLEYIKRIKYDSLNEPTHER